MSQTKDFLVELGTEELPPKALATLAKAFHQNIVERLEAAELTFAKSEWFATPRRLTVRVTELKTQQEDKVVERQGPAVAAAFDGDGNPKPAAIGFAKSCGTEVDKLERIETPKGERLAFKAEVKGATAKELLPEIIESSLGKLPIPKAMRWGDSTAEFIRPPHWLLILLGENIVDANILELTSGNQSFGHRFHAPEAITITQPSKYEDALREAKVDVDFESRKRTITNQVNAIAEKHQATAVIEDDLLNEVAALVEWPVALDGQFDDAFLEVPAEALIATMQADQKYFHLVDGNNKLLPRFITVSNIESKHPQSVVSGNERVIRPRLADAKFFFDSDKKSPLDSYQDKLKNVVFQKQLGTLFDKSQRIKQLAGFIANQLNTDVASAERAADICKCDLMSSMVYEFPELQGIMGRYYADLHGENAQVSAAMDEIYMPRFAGDNLPQSDAGVALALADRMDTLVGIFGIGQAPTGAKDPFALRRAALGVIRIIVEKELPLDLGELIDESVKALANIELDASTKTQLLEFFAARSHAWYQEQSFSAQVIQSVTALNLTQPFDLSKRIKAVAEFNEMEESEALAAANKRVGNILSKSDVDVNQFTIQDSLFELTEEKSLHQQITSIHEQVAEKVNGKHYDEALKLLASLRQPVDAFFDKVMVNTDDEAVKNNRLALLKSLRDMFLSIADISLLQK
ncbi:glycine--tRNA ligase subunit beta [Pleionea sediminis]|uniref:glycine--tRNA ligase subunit beta n=1 Tax=Pleionea sediminis TaxID=2569479 RepID=UPI0011859028|nr:glycine--tRNA ligase subunit beta [Pleionea sediminis]